MAILEFSYNSRALKAYTNVCVILPENKGLSSPAGMPDVSSYKTVYLLHGLGDDHRKWIQRTNIERYANERRIAVVMPEGGRSWYTDTAYGVNYFTFVSQELPLVCQGYFKGMSDRREDNLIAGLSMGGYGAVKVALSCPDRFFGCASLSGALDITRDGRPYLLEEWKGIFGFDTPDASVLQGTKHDVFAIARELAERKKNFPKMYLWCGTEDALLKMNRRFHQLLVDLKIAHRYEESKGSHDWNLWDSYIQVALDYLLDESKLLTREENNVSK